MNCGLRRMNWLRHELLPPLLFSIWLFLRQHELHASVHCSEYYFNNVILRAARQHRRDLIERGGDSSAKLIAPHKVRRKFFKESFNQSGSVAIMKTSCRGRSSSVLP